MKKLFLYAHMIYKWKRKYITLCFQVFMFYLIQVLKTASELLDILHCDDQTKEIKVAKKVEK